MKKRIIPIVIVVAVAAVAGFYLLRHWNGDGSDRNERDRAEGGGSGRNERGGAEGGIRAQARLKALTGSARRTRDTG